MATTAHLGLAWGVSQLRPPATPPATTPLMHVVLLAPPRPAPPPEPPPTPAISRPGGGRSSAPSVVRPAPPSPQPPEILAPPQPVEQPTLVIGAAATATPSPGMGQGGQGQGAGTGVGDGAGSGSGGRARFLKGPTRRQIIAHYPPAARAARLDGQAELLCHVRADQRLDGCRILRETPPGHGFGAAGVAVAEAAFRFRPPMRDGRADPGAQVVVGVAFGRGVPGA